MTDRPSPSGRSPRRGARRGDLQVTVVGRPAEVHEAIRCTVRRVLAGEGRHSGRVEVAMVGAAEMRRQHAHWLGLESVTDVLTFDLLGRQSSVEVDGQLIVCVSMARRRARSRGTDWRAELLLYVVHGCLHLCGYDDNDVEASARMHRREDQILISLGMGPVYAGSAACSRKKIHRA